MKGFDNHPYIPNSAPEIQAEMLREIGLASLEELHKNVPDALKLKDTMKLPRAFGSEYELRRHVEGLLGKNTDCKKILPGYICHRRGGTLKKSGREHRFVIKISHTT